MLNRRKFIKTALAALAGTAVPTFLYTWRVEPHWLEIVRRDLPIHGLPSALEGKTLAQLSDLHVGPQVDDDYILNTFAQVRALQPDLVAFTGDWISYRGHTQLNQLERVMERVPHGRLGTVGILGNHDYGMRWRMLEVAKDITAIAHQAGVKILRNEAVDFAGLQINGLDDLWGPCFSNTHLSKSCPGITPTLVLCHNPDAVDLPIWGNFQGWILAGHTHGGQCKPPFLPAPLLPVSNRLYTAGEYTLSGNRRLYINRGVGHLLQVRFNVRPEVTLFRLCAAA